ncbi:unnamed protein product, partial [Symbiodinium microadriaticum]
MELDELAALLDVDVPHLEQYREASACAISCLERSSLQVLGLQHSMMSASDPNTKCREFVSANSRGATHWFSTLEDQMAGKPCQLHPWSAHGCCPAPETADLGVIGAPCHPFSVHRAKRRADGSVASHAEYKIMTQQVIKWLQTFQPKVCILEQVPGFGQAEDSRDTGTPLERFVQDVGCASFSRDRGYRIVKFDINMNIFVRVNRPRHANTTREAPKPYLATHGVMESSDETLLELENLAGLCSEPSGSRETAADSLDELMRLQESFDAEVGTHGVNEGDSFSFEPQSVSAARRGRPRGSVLLREAQEEARNLAVPPVSSAPRPGSTEFAREVRAEKVAARKLDEHRLQAAGDGSVVPLLSTSSSLWAALRSVGSHEHRCLCSAAWYSFQHQQSEARQNEMVTKLCTPHREHRSKAVLAVDANTTAPTVSRALMRVTAALFEGGNLLWGGMLHATAAAIRSGGLVPVLFVSKLLFDETPTRVRVRADDVVPWSAASTDQSERAKVMQTAHEVHMVLRDSRTGKTAHVRGWPCVPLSYDFMGEAPYQKWVAASFTCDVHKTDHVRRHATRILDDDVSFMLASALSQDGPDTVVRLRRMLNEILQSRLEIRHSPPPEGDIKEHRRQVHDLYLPVPSDVHMNPRSRTPGTLVRLRQRFIIMTLLNGNLQEHAVVHWCTFGCCQDEADTRRKVRLTIFGPPDGLAASVPIPAVDEEDDFLVDDKGDEVPPEERRKAHAVRAA